jgi:hypothetical protein
MTGRTRSMILFWVILTFKCVIGLCYSLFSEPAQKKQRKQMKENWPVVGRVLRMKYSTRTQENHGYAQSYIE